MYAYFKKLDYFSTECIYAQYASRIRFAREFVKGLEVRQGNAAWGGSLQCAAPTWLRLPPCAIMGAGLRRAL